MRTRPHKPTALKLIDGNPGRRPINQNEPKPDPALLEPPANLKGMARQEWIEMAAELHKLKLLSNIDRAALAAYCQSWAIWNAAVAGLNRMAERGELSDSLMIKTKSGNLIQNPLIGAVNKSAAAMLRFAVEFGMTPSARANIALSDGLVQEPLAKLLKLPQKRA